MVRGGISCCERPLNAQGLRRGSCTRSAELLCVASRRRPAAVAAPAESGRMPPQLMRGVNDPEAELHLSRRKQNTRGIESPARARREPGPSCGLRCPLVTHYAGERAVPPLEQLMTESPKSAADIATRLALLGPWGRAGGQRGHKSGGNCGCNSLLHQLRQGKKPRHGHQLSLDLPQLSQHHA